MKPTCSSRRSNFLMAIAFCGLVLMALPQQAHAFLGIPMCPFKKNDALTASLKVIGQDTKRMIVVVNADGTIIGSSFDCSSMQKCSSNTQKCAAAAKKCNASSKKCTKPAGKNCSKIQCPDVKQTLADGKTRTVTRKCGSKNMTATITALKNAQGKIIGAVIVGGPKQS